MIITDLKIAKLPHDDQRYPDADALKRSDGTVIPFSDIYLCEMTLADGAQRECDFWVTPQVGDMTPQRIGDMLRMFAAAIEKDGQAKAA